ncbi:MAG: hypothetical protein KDD56_03670 [Bdellovibrionales bacterium]|nr:hypothetical protein [Bdellovibrionales bacterium]
MFNLCHSHGFSLIEERLRRIVFQTDKDFELTEPELNKSYVDLYEIKQNWAVVGVFDGVKVSVNFQIAEEDGEEKFVVSTYCSQYVRFFDLKSFETVDLDQAIKRFSAYLDSLKSGILNDEFLHEQNVWKKEKYDEQGYKPKGIDPMSLLRTSSEKWELRFGSEKLSIHREHPGQWFVIRYSQIETGFSETIYIQNRKISHELVSVREKPIDASEEFFRLLSSGSIFDDFQKAAYLAADSVKQKSGYCKNLRRFKEAFAKHPWKEELAPLIDD